MLHNRRPEEVRLTPTELSAAALEELAQLEKSMVAESFSESPILQSVAAFDEEEAVYRLKKGAFSDRTRLLLVAGLEGTGHHAIHSMFSVCEEKNLCKADQALTTLLMKYDNPKRLNFGLFGGAGGPRAIHDMLSIEAQLRRMKASNETQLFYVGLRSTQGSGMLSYPNFNGDEKSLDHPDAFILALLAEYVGIDFRLLVLQRAADSVVASTLKRGFGGSAGQQAEPKILIDNAAAYSQLSMLDRSFFHCVHYEDFSQLSDGIKSTISDFLHPETMTRSGVFAEMLKEFHSTSSTAGNSSAEDHRDGADQHRLMTMEQEEEDLRRRQQRRQLGSYKNTHEGHLPDNLDRHTTATTTTHSHHHAYHVSRLKSGSTVSQHTHPPSSKSEHPTLKPFTPHPHTAKYTAPRSSSPSKEFSKNWHEYHSLQLAARIQLIDDLCNRV